MGYTLERNAFLVWAFIFLPLVAWGEVIPPQLPEKIILVSPKVIRIPDEIVLKSGEKPSAREFLKRLTR